MEQITEQQFNDARINDGIHYPLPEPCISAGVHTGRRLIFATPGNISLVKGAEKSGKSFFKSLLLAGAIGGRADHYTETFRGHGLQNKLIIEIDTEQDVAYTAMNRNRVLKMVGVDALPNYITLSTRAMTYQKRMDILKWIFEDSPGRDKLGLVFIDGFVDLIADFNDNKQSRELVEQLMIWSQTTGAHISGVIHTNPGDSDFKARGHLGTMLQQKCETVVVIQKPQGGSTHTIHCQRSRGMSFDDIEFKINDDWLPIETTSEFNPADFV